LFGADDDGLGWVGMVEYGDFWVKVKNLAFSGFPLFYLVSSPFGLFYHFVFLS